MKRYDQLEITDSFMFAKVMSDKEICKATLEQILNIKIRDIKYLDYEETIQVAPGAKGVRLDIYVMTRTLFLTWKCKPQVMRNYLRGHAIIRM